MCALLSARAVVGTRVALAAVRGATMRPNAADERLAEASTAALAIVVVGLLPMVIICRQIAKRQAVTAC